MVASAAFNAKAPYEATWHDALVLVPLLVLISTPLELAGIVQFAGPASLLRTIALMLFLAAAALKYRLSVFSIPMLFILIMSGYFLLLNVFQMTAFALMGLMFIALGVAAGSSLGRSQPMMLDVLLKSYIGFNLLGLGIGFALLWGTGEIVDVHQLVFPFSSSRAAEYLGRVRLSGFQVEPGTYSNIVYIFVLMRVVLRGRLYSRLDLVAMLSTLATLAAWAVIGVIAYIVALCLEVLLSERSAGAPRRTLYAGMILLFLVIMVPFGGMIAESDIGSYFATRYEGGEASGSTDFKITTFNAWWANLGIRTLWGAALPDTYCSYCESPQDLGLLPNMAFYLGLIPTAVLVAMMSVRLWRISLAVLVFALPVAVTKFYFYDPLVWMLFGIIMGSAFGDFRGGRDDARDEAT